MEEIVLAVVGSRGFDDYNLLKIEIDKIAKNYKILCICSGGAEGADSLAERYAKENNIKTTIFIPDWKTYGKKKAGDIRNQSIVAYSDKVICFWDGTSKGTAITISMARRVGKKDLPDGSGDLNRIYY